jgi:hypothetical protein
MIVHIHIRSSSFYFAADSVPLLLCVRIKEKMFSKNILIELFVFSLLYGIKSKQFNASFKTEKEYFIKRSNRFSKSYEKLAKVFNLDQ